MLNWNGTRLALYQVKAVLNHSKGGKKMRTNKIKRALSLVLILSLVVGWFNVNICGAQEGQEIINMESSQAEVKLPEQTSSDAKEERSILDHPLADIIQLPLLAAFMPVWACLFLTYGILGKDTRAFVW
jgi:hypothetical protein